MNVLSKVSVVVLATGLLAGCHTYDGHNAAVGGTAGAVIGAVAGKSVTATIAGAAIGAAAGVLIGRVAAGSDDCYYRDRKGRRYIDECPD